MSETYNGFELNEYLQSGWFDVENALFKAIIDMLPDYGSTLVTSQHTHAKLVASDGDPDPALSCDADGNVIIGNGGPAAADAMLHIWGATAGAVTALDDTLAVIENDSTAYLSFLTPNNVSGGIIFGDPDNNNVGGLIYSHISDQVLLRAGGNTLLTADTVSGVVVGAAYPLTSSETRFAGIVTAAAGGTLEAPTAFDVTTKNRAELTPTADAQYYQPSGTPATGQIVVVTNMSTYFCLLKLWPGNVKVLGKYSIGMMYTGSQWSPMVPC